ncbi:hypothetical protein M433DRAFT_226867 [Acidomyces richmondensis BFW]|nr:MAG: hypothetical protein FE78DRAFT_376572 [Acidomyces sp. 'richmondensis']KYG46025.1 hypothetical protein M433DRAFT_226867 [Acidomyces richmondensis BFW]
MSTTRKDNPLPARSCSPVPLASAVRAKSCADGLRCILHLPARTRRCPRAPGACLRPGSRRGRGEASEDEGVQRVGGSGVSCECKRWGSKSSSPRRTTSPWAIPPKILQQSGRDNIHSTTLSPSHTAFIVQTLEGGLVPLLFLDDNQSACRYSRAVTMAPIRSPCTPSHLSQSIRPARFRAGMHDANSQPLVDARGRVKPPSCSRAERCTAGKSKLEWRKHKMSVGRNDSLLSFLFSKCVNIFQSWFLVFIVFVFVCRSGLVPSS